MEKELVMCSHCGKKYLSFFVNELCGECELAALKELAKKKKLSFKNSFTDR